MRDLGPTHLIYITDLELQCNLIVNEGQLEHINYASQLSQISTNLLADLNENFTTTFALLNLLIYNMNRERNSVYHTFVFFYNDKYKS